MKAVWPAYLKTLFAALILSGNLHAQQKDIPPDSLRAKMGYYGIRKPNSALFAHFDKTIYNAGETAWFTAYVLNKNKAAINPTVLTAILVSEADRSVVLNLKFVVKNNTAYGNIDLPETLRPGNYSMILYTNALLNGQPQDIFTQHISVKGLAVVAMLPPPQKTGAAPVINPLLSKPVIKFYPEGGNLINATTSYVGVEAKDASGKPVKLKALLYKDKRVVDTIVTDSYGMGKFIFKPYLKSNYEVKLLNDNTVYRLPVILPQGPVLHLSNAVVNDSLQLRMADVQGGRYHVIVHNYHQVFYSYHIRLSAAAKSSTLGLKDVPKGIAIVTVLDSLNRPVAERLFFAHYNMQANVNLATDKETYTTRQKVTLKLKLTNYNADTLSGAVSIACVQASRLQPNNVQDIAGYFYLQNDLTDLPLKALLPGQSAADKNLLENVLLIRGWRRYNWAAMMRSYDTDTAVESFIGPNGLPGNTYLDPFSALVDIAGRIDITKYFINQNHRVNNLLNEIVLKLLAQVKQINSFLISKLSIKKSVDIVDQFTSGNSEPITIPKKSTLLNTVDVKATKIYNYIANDCGDYVCRFNVLNCVAHKHEKDNNLPKIGARYTVDDSSLLVNNPRVVVRYTFKDDKGKSIAIVSYAGCANLKSDLKIVNDEGLTEYREFYSSDYTQIPLSQPDYLTTIYWQHACKVNSNNEVQLNFYTSDATGSFKIIVQGVAGTGVLYSEKTILVKNE